MQESITCPKCASEDVTFSKKKQLYVCPDCLHEFIIEKKTPYRRIFLSYGHDEYAPLAEQLKTDLQNRGHEVWFDLECLKPGGDWEAYIAEGLEWVSKTPKEGRFLLLMTPHSVRRPDGYCLNEIARALERKLIPIPVMVKQCEPPLSICRIQWLDMEDCVPVQERTEKYKVKFARLLEALEEDRIDFEGVQMRLIQRLSPLPFEADILPNLTRFTGRQWVFDRIDAWLADTKASRVFWIMGKPGVGKTAIAAWLCTNRGEIAAFHLCRHGHAEKSNPQKAILSIAYQLSSQLPDYQERLNSLDLEKIIIMESPQTVFDNLIVQPLTGIQRPGRNFVVLIDALDEATIGGKNELASFIGSEFDRTPDWLRLIITSRHEPEVIHPLQALTPYVLDASTPENEEDIRAFLKRELKTFTGGKEVEQHVIDTIFQKSEGIFLYVEYIRKELLDKRLSLDDLDKFPQGLGGVYVQFFERKFSDINKFKKTYRSVLELITATQEPLEVKYLTSIFGWSAYDKKDMLDAFGSLFSVSNNRIQPFHKSVIDWLTDQSKAGNYFISAEEGHKRLAEYGWKEYQGGSGKMSRYSVVHLPVHLSLMGRKEELRKLLFDFDWIQIKLEAADASSIIKDYNFLPDDRTLRLVQGALRLSAHILTDRRQLPSQLTGRLLSFQEPEIRSLLEQARNGKTRMWLRPLIPSLMPPCGHLLRNIILGSGSGETIAITPNGQWIVSPAAGNNLKVWDLLSGEELKILRGHSGQVRAMTITADGQYVISASEDKTLKVWDLYSEKNINTIMSPGMSALAVAVTPDGRLAISSEEEHTLGVWDLRSGKAFKVLRGHIGLVRALAVTRDGRLAVSASGDKTLKIWDMQNGEAIKIFEDHGISGETVAITPDGRLIIAPSDDSTLKVWDLRSGQVVKTLIGHSNLIRAVSVTPDGKKVVSASRDKTVKIWDLQSGKLLETLNGHTKEVGAVAITPDGQFVVSADKTLRVWDLKSGKILRTLDGHSNSANAIAITPDGQIVVSTSIDQELKFWDIQSGAELNILSGRAEPARAVAITADWKLVVSAEKSLKVWDFKSGKILKTFRRHSISGWVVAVSSDGNRVISTLEEHPLNVWDLESGQAVKILRGHTQLVRGIAVTSDGQRAVSTSWDKTIKVWDMESGKTVMTLNWHGILGEAVAVTPDGQLAIAPSDDNTIKVWNLNSGKIVKSLEGHARWVNAVAISLDGRLAISASRDRALKVWDMNSGKALITLEEHTNLASSVAITPDGQQAVSASIDGTLKVWNLNSGGDLKIPNSHTDFVRTVAITPDGRIAISASNDHTLIVWDIQSGEQLKILSGHTGEVWSVAITPDGQQAVSGSRDRTLRIWDLRSEKTLKTLTVHTEAITAVAITPDGRIAISASYDECLKVWDIQSGELLNTLRGHTGLVTSVAITPDSRLAVSGSLDSTLKIWDLNSGRNLKTLKGHPDSVDAVTITPDGRLAVSGGTNDNSLRLWDLQSRKVLGVVIGSLNSISSIAITPDGYLAVCASHTLNDFVDILELGSGKEIKILRGHTNSIEQVITSHNGQIAVSVSLDHTLTVWNLDSGNIVAKFTADGGLVRVAIAPDGVAIVAGEESGQVHFLRLEGAN